MITSFDLFGTLVDASRPTDPATAVATELAARGVGVPEDWSDAYAESHIGVPTGAEVPLPAHVTASLESRGIHPTNDDERGAVVRRAVVAAFEPTEIETRRGATAAVTAAASQGRVAVLSNCSVPGLARRALHRSSLDDDVFDAIVTSVDCGWRKPNARAFETVAARLNESPTNLVHVGDDPRTDGGADAAGATSVLLSETSLTAIPTVLETMR